MPKPELDEHGNPKPVEGVLDDSHSSNAGRKLADELLKKRKISDDPPGKEDAGDDDDADHRDDDEMDDQEEQIELQRQRRQQRQQQEDDEDEEDEEDDEKGDNDVINIPDDVLDTKKKEESQKKKDDLPPEEMKSPKGMTTEQAAAFEKMREALVAARKELKQKASGQVDDEVFAKVRDENLQLRKTLAQYDLRFDPDFQQQYMEPLKVKGAEVAKVIQEFGGTEEMAKTVLQMNSLKDRRDYLQNNVPDAVTLLMPALAEIERIRGKMQEDLKSADVKAKQLIKDRETRVAKQRGEILEAVTTELGGTGHFLLRKSSSDEAWNEGVEQRVKDARAILSGKDDKALVQSVIKGVMADKYLELYRAAYAKLKKLHGDLKQRQRFSDGGFRRGEEGGGGGGGGGSGERREDRPKSGADVADRILSR